MSGARCLVAWAAPVLLGACSGKSEAPPPRPAPAASSATAPDALVAPKPEAPPLDELAPGTDAQQAAIARASEKLNAGDLDGALMHYAEAMTGPVTGTSVSAGLGAANLFEARKEGARARQVYEKLLADAGKQSPEVQFAAARFLAGQGESERAIAGFRAAVEMQPDFLPAYPPLGGLLVQAGRNEEAARHMLQYEVRLNQQIRVVRSTAPLQARLSVMDLLATLDDERVGRVMVELLHSPSKEMRISAAGAIADAPTPGALEALRTAAEIETLPFVKRVLSEAVKRAEQNQPQ